MKQFSKSTLLPVFVTALAFSAVVVAAEPVPPPSLPDEITAPPTLRFKPASRLTMGRFVARFESTTLSQVIKAAGLGNIEHHGDAGNSIYWLCYTIPGEGTSQRVWIIAHGEMGGSDHSITEVIAMRLSSDTKSSDGCPNLPKRLQPLSLDRGIWLNTSASQLTRVLGKPSESRDDWRVYYYLGKVPGKYQGPRDQGERVVQFDESSLLETRVVEGKVVTLQAAKLTTN